jgi:hypothetical protein
MVDLTLPDDSPAPDTGEAAERLVARVQAWQHRHPLARRLPAADIGGLGVIALPFDAPEAGGKPRPLFHQPSLVPGLSHRALVEFAQRHAVIYRPGPADWPLREVERADASTEPAPETRYLLTAAITGGAIPSPADRAGRAGDLGAAALEPDACDRGGRRVDADADRSSLGTARSLEPRCRHATAGCHGGLGTGAFGRSLSSATGSRGTDTGCGIDTGRGAVQACRGSRRCQRRRAGRFGAGASGTRAGGHRLGRRPGGFGPESRDGAGAWTHDAHGAGCLGAASGQLACVSRAAASTEVAADARVAGGGCFGCRRGISAVSARAGRQCGDTGGPAFRAGVGAVEEGFVVTLWPLPTQADAEQLADVLSRRGVPMKWLEF